MNDLIDVKFIVTPDYDLDEFDPDEDDLDSFSIKFPKWNLPKIGEHLVFEDETDGEVELHFFAVISKHYAIKDGEIKDSHYVVKKHGTPNEFDYLKS